MSGAAMALYSFEVAKAAATLPFWGQCVYYSFIGALLLMFLSLLKRKG